MSGRRTLTPDELNYVSSEILERIKDLVYMGGVKPIKDVLELKVLDFDDLNREFSINYEVKVNTGNVLQIIGRHERPTTKED